MKKQFNLYIEEDIIRTLRHSAVDAGQSISDHIAEMLVTHLARERRASEYAKGLFAEKRSDTMAGARSKGSSPAPQQRP